MKGAALRSLGLFQGKYHASAAISEKPSWTSKGNIIWYSHDMYKWLIGNGKHAIIYSSFTQSIPYDKEIQWYFQGKNLKKEKIQHGEIDIKCTMKTGEPYILDYENLEILFNLSRSIYNPLIYD